MNQNEVGSLKPPRVTKMLKVKPEGALEKGNQSLHQKNQWENPVQTLLDLVTQARQEATLVNQWPGVELSNKVPPAAKMPLKADCKLYDQTDSVRMLG